MKSKLLLLVAAFFISSSVFGQFTFSVSPGFKLNTASFGYKFNKLVPYIGIQHLNANYNFEQTGERYDYLFNRVESYTENIDLKGNLLIPNIGLKYFIKDVNSLKAYFSLNISKPIVTGKIELGDSDSENDREDEFRDVIKNSSVWGGELGFGVEYFFDENFSIGGEFGLRHLRLHYNDTFDRTFFNPDLGYEQDTDIENDVKFNMSPTFSKISLNFYF